MMHEQGIIAASRIKYYWLGLLLIAIMIMIGVGGLTRLTNSGLSMVEWKLFMGMIPPLSNDAWLAAFDLYKRYPEYQLLYSTMTLNEFKFIFALEYIHRILGRLIGVMVIVPFALLWLKKQLTRYEIGCFFVLLGLVSLQGAIGWFMVKSGLVNVPHISHFRLALHFFFALLFMSVTVLLLLIYRKSRSFNLPNVTAPQFQEVPQHYTEQTLPKTERLPERLSKTAAGKKVAVSDLTTKFISNPISLGFLSITSVFLVLQMLYGAFMAGLEAGYISQTYPAMFGKLIPSVHLAAGYEQHGFKSLLENTTWIHFIHRHLGVITSLILLGFAIQTLIRLKNFKSSVVHRHNAEYYPHNHMYNVPRFSSNFSNKGGLKAEFTRKDNSNENTPNENNFNQNIPNGDNFNQNIPNEDNFNQNIPNEDNFNQNIPNEDNFNQNIPDEYDFNRNTSNQNTHSKQNTYYKNNRNVDSISIDSISTNSISETNIDEDNINKSAVQDRASNRSYFKLRFLDNLPVIVLYAVILLSLIQPMVGILTVMWSIPISLALIHQLLAVLLFQSLVVLFFYRLYAPKHLKYFYKLS
ncbi:Heme A synthase [Spirochaetota bacterium]|nr:Heme A synthase [Spirochaetota bacterium]